MAINTVSYDTNLFQGSDVLIIGNGFDLDLGLKTDRGPKRNRTAPPNSTDFSRIVIQPD